jgi:hypothetical protein
MAFDVTTPSAPRYLAYLNTSVNTGNFDTNSRFHRGNAYIYTEL